MSDAKFPPDFSAYLWHAETQEPLKGWTKTSNLLIEHLYPKKVSGALQMAIILHIARHTWGDNKKLWTRLVIERMAEEWGVTDNAVRTASDDAQRRGIIERKKFANPKSAAVYRIIGKNWEHVPDYEKEERPELEDAGLSIVARQLVLFPGKHSRWFTIRIGDRDQQVRYCNQTGTPVTLAVEVTADGSLVFAARSPKTASKTVEDNGSPLREKFTVSSPTPEENKELTETASHPKKQQQKHLKFPAPPASRPIPEEDARTVAFRSWLSSLILGRWKKALDEELFFQIMQKAPACPLDVFSEVVYERLKRDSLRKLRVGILIDLAGDAEEAYRAMQEAQTKEAAAAQPDGESEEELRERMVRKYGEEAYAELERGEAPERVA